MVPLEDNRVVPEGYSRLLRKLSERFCAVYVHRASYDDVRRDRDLVRREQSLSKLAKYAIREKSDRSIEQLSISFGAICNENDEADCHILSALYDNAVDALVTEDNDLHRRAQKGGIQDRVFRVKEMLDYLGEQHSDSNSTVTFVESRFCYQVNFDDPIFQTLAEDYLTFKDWWRKCCSSDRKCWIVRDQTLIAGIVVYNDESTNGGDGRFTGKKTLKLCTFKVSEAHRGGRLGEQLLKQSIWYAFSNRYQVVYLTVYPRQTSLIDLLCYYGFSLHSAVGGELVYARDFESVRVSGDEYEWHRLNYPRLLVPPICSAIVPIQAQFHKRLLPEASNYRPDVTPDFFDGLWSSGSKEHHIPATTIRKVYVCKSNLRELPRGTRLYFYASKNEELIASQSISALGIVEEFREVNTANELLQLTAKRSVYRPEELQKMFDRGGHAKLLNFIVIGIVERPLGLEELIAASVLRAAPQSMVRIASEASRWLSERVQLTHLT